jgi:hypothetical protein
MNKWGCVGMKIRIRAGITLNITKEQGDAILAGTHDALIDVLKNAQHWAFDGETYIPADGNDELDMKNDVDFSLSTKVMHCNHPMKMCFD